jgi:hypothetical protein
MERKREAFNVVGFDFIKIFDNREAFKESKSYE